MDSHTFFLIKMNVEKYENSRVYAVHKYKTLIVTGLILSLTIVGVLLMFGGIFIDSKALAITSIVSLLVMCGIVFTNNTVPVEIVLDAICDHLWDKEIKIGISEFQSVSLLELHILSRSIPQLKYECDERRQVGSRAEKILNS